MQFSLVISHCNITFSLFLFSQGSVATLIRWGGWSSYHVHVSFIINFNSENCTKIRSFFTKLRTKICWLRFFMAHGVDFIKCSNILSNVVMYVINYHCEGTMSLPSVLWHCWLGIRKSMRPVGNCVMRCWRGCLSGAKCRWFAYSPADATATPSSLAPVKSSMV